MICECCENKTDNLMTVGYIVGDYLNPHCMAVCIGCFNVFSEYIEKFKKEVNNRICPRCKKEKHFIDMQGVKHCQSIKEIEVCTDCKTEFIRLNDLFFKDIKKQ